MYQLKRIAAAASFGWLTFLLALSIAWFSLAQANFLYGFWHDHIGIEEGIAKYAPQNRFRPGFESTTRQQRIALFAEINRAIHNGGNGLGEIYYDTVNSEGPRTLLRAPEIIHLQDVAHLLNHLWYAVLAVFISWPLICYRLWRQGKFPSVKLQMVGVGAVAIIVAIVLLGFGAESVFNQLHIWVFPEGHQWFFYYQESLMSTMMLAPRLFAGIALAWVGLSLAVFIVLQIAIAQLIARKTRNSRVNAPD